MAGKDWSEIMEDRANEEERARRAPSHHTRQHAQQIEQLQRNVRGQRMAREDHRDLVGTAGEAPRRAIELEERQPSFEEQLERVTDPTSDKRMIRLNELRTLHAETTRLFEAVKRDQTLTISVEGIAAAYHLPKTNSNYARVKQAMCAHFSDQLKVIERVTLNVALGRPESHGAED